MIVWFWYWISGLLLKLKKPMRTPCQLGMHDWENRYAAGFHFCASWKQCKVCGVRESEHSKMIS